MGRQILGTGTQSGGCCTCLREQEIGTGGRGFGCSHAASMHSPHLAGAGRHTNEVEITDRAQGHGTARKNFVIDVKTVAMVDGNGSGVWDEMWNPATIHHDNPGLLTAEQTKYHKHEAQYAQTGHSFVALVCSCFGALGPS